MKKCEAGFYWRPIDIQLTSPSNRWMTTHNARARYHDFYRRHRFAWTKRKGGWDVGSPGSKSIRSVVFWMFIFPHILVFFHTQNNNVVKMVDCPDPFPAFGTEKTSHFGSFPVKFHSNWETKALRHAEILAMGTARAPSGRIGPSPIGVG